MQVYLVGTTDHAHKALTKLAKNRTSTKIYSERKIKSLEDILSPNAQKIFIDSQLALSEDKYKDYDFRIKLMYPLVMTPFKLPDSVSQVRSSESFESGKVFIEDFSPIKQQIDLEKQENSYYIDPKFLLDTDKFSGYEKAEDI